VEKNKKVNGKKQENPVEKCPDVENYPELKNNYAGIYLVNFITPLN
jgi:hypothetical protein